MKQLSLLDTDATKLVHIFADLELSDFNYLLYSCEAEERCAVNLPSFTQVIVLYTSHCANYFLAVL